MKIIREILLTLILILVLVLVAFVLFKEIYPCLQVTQRTYAFTHFIEVIATILLLVVTAILVISTSRSAKSAAETSKNTQKAAESQLLLGFIDKFSSSDMNNNLKILGGLKKPFNTDLLPEFPEKCNDEMV